MRCFFVLYDPVRKRYWNHENHRWTRNIDCSKKIKKASGSYSINCVKLFSQTAAMNAWFEYLIYSFDTKKVAKLQLQKFKTIDVKTPIDTRDLVSTKHQDYVMLGELIKKHPKFNANELFTEIFHSAVDYKYILLNDTPFNDSEIAASGPFNKGNCKIQNCYMAIKTSEQLIVAKMLFNVAWFIDISPFLGTK